MKPNEWFERKLSEARETIEYKTEKVILEVLDAIYERMEKLEISAAELARKLGVSRSRVSTVLKGKHSMRLDTLIAIADALDAEVKIVLNCKKENSKDSLKYLDLNDEKDTSFSSGEEYDYSLAA